MTFIIIFIYCVAETPHRQELCGLIHSLTNAFPMIWEFIRSYLPMRNLCLSIKSLRFSINRQNLFCKFFETFRNLILDVYPRAKFG